MSNTDTEITWLAGKLLLAMPDMPDPRFIGAVIFLCAHDEKGAMGLIVNKTIPDLTFSDLLQDMGDDMEGLLHNPKDGSIPVLVGGPVDTARGFLLHSDEFSAEETIRVSENYAVTGTLDALRSVLQEKGAKKKAFALGYASWTAGQLETEIAENSWFVCNPTEEIVFGQDHEDKWHRAFSILGIEPYILRTIHGNA